LLMTTEDFISAVRRESDTYIALAEEEIEAEVREKAVHKPEASRRYATVKWRCDVCHVSGEIENALDVSGVVIANNAEALHAWRSPECAGVRGATKLEFTIDHQAGVW